MSTTNRPTINRTAKVILLVLAAALLCWAVSAFILQIVWVRGDSMSPALSDGKPVVINKITGKYNKGDVVVFRAGGVDGLVIKRVVATSGDTMEIIDGTLYINGEVCSLYTEYINEAGILSQKITIGENEVFVLGDNINNSIDSRFPEVGIISPDDIIGVVM